MGQDRIRRDIKRQRRQHAHLTTDDIVAAYEPQIAALARPPRTANSPD
jgi:hypothetical protein